MSDVDQRLAELEKLVTDLASRFDHAQTPSGSSPPPPGMLTEDERKGLVSLFPLNQKQLEILQRAEIERERRSRADERWRDYRKAVLQVLAAVILLLEILRSSGWHPHP